MSVGKTIGLEGVGSGATTVMSVPERSQSSSESDATDVKETERADMVVLGQRDGACLLN